VDRQTYWFDGFWFNGAGNVTAIQQAKRMDTPDGTGNVTAVAESLLVHPEHMPAAADEGNQTSTIADQNVGKTLVANGTRDPDTATALPSGEGTTEAGSGDVEKEAEDKYAGLKPPSSRAVIITSIVGLCLAVVMLIFQVLRPKSSWAEIKAFWAKRSIDSDSEKAGAAGAQKSSSEKAGALDGLESSSEKADPSSGPEFVQSPHRWYVLALMLAVVAANDLYMNMPGLFMYGEAARRDLNESWTSNWLGCSLWFVIVGTMVSSVMLAYGNLFDVQRIAMSLFGLAAIGQALGGLLNDPLGFGTYMVILRILDGLSLGMSELCVMTLLFRLFDGAEMGAANGLVMSVRMLMTLASPPLGGLLYNAGGFAAPFLFTGSLVISMVLLQRFFLFNNTTDAFGPLQNSNILSILKLPAIISIIFAIAVAFMCFMGLENFWQPWLGASSGYGFTPVQISTASITAVVGMAVGSTIIGIPSTLLVGNVITMMMGTSITCGMILFIGAPPLLFPNIPLMPWLPYVVASLLGMGNGLVFVAMMPLLVTILKSNGMNQLEFAGPLATALMIAPSISGGLISAISGPMIHATGVGGAAMILFGFSAASLVFQSITLRKYMYIKSTEE
jgi:MFS family permease